MYGDSSEEEKEAEEPLPPYEIRSSDMSEHLQEKCVRICHSVLLQFTGEDGEKPKVASQAIDMEMATKIKEKIDQDEELRDEGAGWHVVIGKSYACSISCKTKHHVFLDLKEIHKSFLIFKTE
ncbi:unnamed protein product [Moneuplotes crassus]|uniref:Dynein light chain n=1 Tax=Euplotes crassus TaxID=5936 RepID=A0AAD1Y3L6_EUPCR|nr:unnamed protein product [Moneuplotes crassus]